MSSQLELTEVHTADSSAVPETVTETNPDPEASYAYNNNNNNNSTPTAAATPDTLPSLRAHLKNKAASYESELLQWLECTHPFFSSENEHVWWVQTYGNGGGERIALLTRLLALTRNLDVVSDEELTHLQHFIDNQIKSTASTLNAVAITAALFLVLLYSQLFTPAAVSSLSPTSVMYFSSNNIITFQAFFYGLLNFSFALGLFLIVSVFRTTNVLNNWLFTINARLDYLTHCSPLHSAYSLLGFAGFLFLAAIPFGFALLVSPEAALAAMIFYTLIVVIGFHFLVCCGSCTLRQMRADAHAVLNQPKTVDDAVNFESKPSLSYYYH